MIESNYYEDNEDLRFVMEHFVNWEALIPLKEKNYEDSKKYIETKDERYSLAPSDLKETLDNYLDILNRIGHIAGKNVAPVARKMEKEGLKLENGKVIFPEDFLRLFNIVKEAGILGFPMPREYGGLNMPLPCIMGLKEMFTRADNSFEIAIAVSFLSNVLYHFTSQELIEKYVPEMVQGTLSGAMGLTEPDFGSDLAHIITKAEKQSDGTYLITGTKRFITHGCGVGDTPALLFTLARTSGSGGKGLGFFLSKSTDVQVSRIEEKLGLHCSPTCELVYEKTPAILIGKEGEGLIKYVMGMLNHGRMGVAIESIGLAQAAYEEAKKYASERVQFGVLINTFPAIKRLLDEMDSKIQASRAIVYFISEMLEIYELQLAKMQKEGISEKEIRKNPNMAVSDKLTKLLTSVAKLISSEYANEVAYDALQIFGGAGFTEEYDIAKIYRDARISTIYEGTSQIHIITSATVLKDGLKAEGFLEKFLMEKIHPLNDLNRQSSLRQLLTDLLELMSLYQTKEGEIKESRSKEVVFAFSHLLGLVLLAQQIEIAEKKMPEDFVKRKITAFENYVYLTRSVFASAKVYLN
ncbi:MAG: acyl-CoA dehydrogenase family protein [Leptospiraceae bacterium]|nr:acyl-CoA dehydrogenase family protein [Leptospiraceae bacterium]MCP5496440.1 acyl-CoA dehydrogenase family protein [Leptospiraceae bacterium]